MKSIFKSKTFWLAVIQAVASVAVVLLTEMDLVGYVGIVKSVVDVLNRTMTSEKVGYTI